MAGTIKEKLEKFFQIDALGLNTQRGIRLNSKRHQITSSLYFGDAKVTLKEKGAEVGEPLVNSPSEIRLDPLMTLCATPESFGKTIAENTDEPIVRTPGPFNQQTSEVGRAPYLPHPGDRIAEANHNIRGSLNTRQAPVDGVHFKLSRSCNSNQGTEQRQKEQRIGLAGLHRAVRVESEYDGR